MNEKDFDKYVYFICRAENFAVVIRPDKKKTVDGEVVFEEGLRLEFHNKMLRLENDEANQGVIAKLREKIKAEESMDPKRRSFFEETKPETMIPETMVKEKLDEKNKEIEELKEKLSQKDKPADKDKIITFRNNPSDEGWIKGEK